MTVFADDSLFACRERNQALLDRVANLRQQRDAFKRRALRAEARPVLRGRKFYGPEVEKWRGLLQWCFDHWANKMLGRDATEYEVDFGMGLVHHESSGYHLARCHTEWIGTPPPGYDGTDATRATGLCAHVPAYWPSRSRAAGFEGWPILDPFAQLMVMGWMVYDYWHMNPAPNWRHWPDAPDGTPGSTRLVREELAPLYPELAG